MEEKNIKYILENIISKAKLNKQTGKYEIKINDYINLNLSTKKKKLLKKICENLDIELEYIGYTRILLPCIENEQLFQEYNNIKSKLELNLPVEEKIELEARRIEIRNKVVTDNMPFIKSIIDRRIDSINKLDEKEDIYQIGYEILLEYIDNNYLTKETFKLEISRNIITLITRKLLSITDDKDIKELLDKLSIKDKQTEKSLILKKIQPPISLDEEIIKLNNEEQQEKSPLYNDTFENMIIENTNKEILLKVIETLPQKKQDIIKLYYGLNDGISYSMPKIAEIYNITRASVFLIIKKSLINIKSSIRINYLKDMYESSHENKVFKYQNNKTLEEILIIKMKEKIISYYHNKLSKEEIKLLKLYTLDESGKLKLNKELNLKATYLNKLKTKLINKIRLIIMIDLKNQLNREISYEEYLEYLMDIYLKNTKIKKRSKKNGIINK